MSGKGISLYRKSKLRIQQVDAIEEDDFNAGREINILGIILGLFNGGSAFSPLVLPIMVLHSGYLVALVLVLVIGLGTYYTALLIVKHLNKAANMQECILAHFNNDHRYLTDTAFLFG